MTQERINEYVRKMKNGNVIACGDGLMELFCELQDEFTKEIASLKMTKLCTVAYAAAMASVGKAMKSTFEGDVTLETLYSLLRDSRETITIAMPEKEQNDNE